MTLGKVRLLAGFLVLLAAVLVLWTLVEARRQRRAVEATLTTQATVLARSFGPGLVAASHAARELDEIVLWKLLDNARLFAEMDPSGDESQLRLEDLAEANGLASVAYFDGRGQVFLTLGESISESAAESVADILGGRAEEILLGSAQDADLEHISAAVAMPEEGAVLVRIHTSSARAFARRLGVENLLDSLVGSSGVLYLRYSEEPSGRVVEASWDGGPLPEDLAGEEQALIRERSVFEVELPIDAPAGSSATLRVGLDGRPLHEAAAAAMRRTLLVSIVLLGFAVAGTGFAVVSRLRALDREEAARQLAIAEAGRRRSERLAAAGALTAGLAHEVRSPMNAIGLAAQRLERKLDAGDGRRDIAQKIREELQRLEGILREFLELASPVSDRREWVELAGVAGEVEQLLVEEAEAEGVHLKPVEGSGSAIADRGAVRGALINLVRNAIQASPQGGEVSVRIRQKKQIVTIEVTDQGPGIEAELTGQVFDAFVTGRASGTGLGLALVRRVAEEHGGNASLTNRPHGGATAILELPRDGGNKT